MINVEYEELVNLINIGQLIPGQEYRIINYPTESVTVAAETTKTLKVECYTDSGKKGLYKPFNEGFGWDSDYGYLYYVNDGSNDAWFDWINKPIITGCVDTHIMPYYVDGLLTIPEMKVNGCKSCIIYGGSADITKCSNTIIGEGHSGTIDLCKNSTIGKDNTNLNLSNCDGINIGDGNDNITASGKKHIEVGSNNKGITIGADGVIIGSGNDTVSITAEDNEIMDNNLDIHVSSKFNQVRDTKYSSIASNYNIIENSNSVNIESGAVGNAVRSSSLVDMADVNNNSVFTDKLNIKSADAFRAFSFNGNRTITTRENMVADINNQSDQQATVLDVDGNRFPAATKSKNEYYQKDGIWTIGEQKSEVNITISDLSKSESLYVSVSGGGQYKSGELVTLTATITGSVYGFKGFVDLSTGETHSENPYAFTADKDKVFRVMLTRL